MLVWIYSLLVAGLVALTAWTIYKEEKVTFQITCVLVLIPLLLRLFGFK